MTITPDKFIGCELHIVLKDSRILDGLLTVVDPFGNLLLLEGWETSVDKINSKDIHKREIGVVSVPRDSIATVSMEKTTYAKFQSRLLN